MPGYRIVTEDGALDILDGTEAAVKHCRNVANNVGSLLLKTFDDALPDEVVRKPEILDVYTYDPQRAERSRRTWTLGKPVPAFPREQMIAPSTPEEWRVRAFYYALGQVESLWELSPLVTEDAVRFSYYWEALVGSGREASIITLRTEWVQWEAARRADLERGEQALNVNVSGGVYVGPPRPGVDYLEGGEHDPNLGPDLRETTH